MKVMKRIAALLLALLLLCLAALPGFAYEGIDMDKTGSVSLTMRYDGEAVGGGAFTVYRVGKVVDDDGDYSFALAGDFADSGYSLKNVGSASLAKKLANFAAEEELSGTRVKIMSDGRATAAKLELGLYLFVQTTAAEGYEAVHPFLVSVPMYEDGAYTYDVDATPKLSITKKTTPPDEPDKPKHTPEKTTKLPQTGQLNWPVPVLAASGLGLMLCGWLLRSRKKNRYAD